MALPAGDLRHQLKLQKPQPGKDSEGGAITVFVDVVTVWARRTNTLRATAEAVASGSTVAPVQVQFDMRPRAIDASWRMVGVGGDHEGVIYDIKNVGIANDRSEMAVIAVSGASNG